MGEFYGKVELERPVMKWLREMNDGMMVDLFFMFWMIIGIIINFIGILYSIDYVRSTKLGTNDKMLIMCYWTSTFVYVIGICIYFSQKRIKRMCKVAIYGIIYGEEFGLYALLSDFMG